MAAHGSTPDTDIPMISVLSSSLAVPDAALRWYAGPADASALHLTPRAPRPFGLDDEERERREYA